MMKYAIAFALCAATPLSAGDVSIVDAKARLSGSSWRFDVTLSHEDTGWEHYADGWEVLGPDGTQLGYRELLHPHVNEQPFTRSLSGVEIPSGVSTVTIRAHDSVHGWSPETVQITLDAQ